MPLEEEDAEWNKQCVDACVFIHRCPAGWEGEHCQKNNYNILTSSSN